MVEFAYNSVYYRIRNTVWLTSALLGKDDPFGIENCWWCSVRILKASCELNLSNRNGIHN
jgi:hypothetical protein